MKGNFFHIANMQAVYIFGLHVASHTSDDDDDDDDDDYYYYYFCWT